MSGANTQFAVATHALVYIAGVGGSGVDGRNRPISSDELAASVAAAPVHLRRVLGALRRAGLVTSRAGNHGGWLLARPAETIHVDEVWTALTSNSPVASHRPSLDCAIGQHVKTVISALEQESSSAVCAALHKHTIGQLAAEAGAVVREP